MTDFQCLDYGWKQPSNGTPMADYLSSAYEELTMANNTSDYRGTGTEPLRSDPKALNGSVTPSPSGGGKDAGGTENLKAQTQTFQTTHPMPGKGTTHIPAGVQSFDGEKV